MATYRAPCGYSTASRMVRGATPGAWATSRYRPGASPAKLSVGAAGVFRTRRPCKSRRVTTAPGGSAGNWQLAVAGLGYTPASRAAAGRVALPLLAQLRTAGIPAELYPDAKKLGVQFKYADAKGIPLVLIMGPEEVAAGVVKVKIMQTGVERVLPLAEVVAALTAE